MVLLRKINVATVCAQKSDYSSTMTCLKSFGSAHACVVSQLRQLAPDAGHRFLRSWAGLEHPGVPDAHLVRAQPSRTCQDSHQPGKAFVMVYCLPRFPQGAVRGSILAAIISSNI